MQLLVFFQRENANFNHSGWRRMEFFHIYILHSTSKFILSNYGSNSELITKCLSQEEFWKMKHRTYPQFLLVFTIQTNCHYLQIQQKPSSANSASDDGVCGYSKLWISPQDTMGKASFHLKIQLKTMRSMKCSYHLCYLRCRPREKRLKGKSTWVKVEILRERSIPRTNFKFMGCIFLLHRI